MTEKVVLSILNTQGLGPNNYGLRPKAYGLLWPNILPQGVLMTNVTTVFLDVDDTLLDFHKCAKESMFSVARELSLPFPENAMEIFHPINNGLWERINSG